MATSLIKYELQNSLDDYLSSWKFGISFWTAKNGSQKARKIMKVKKILAFNHAAFCEIVRIYNLIKCFF